ncbi:hypothetical protein B7486_52745 [cyanobacterium TDX16]|nr:hypothetical protein B7486_52745 [cyanobacterium TDX16]
MSMEPGDDQRLRLGAASLVAMVVFWIAFVICREIVDAPDGDVTAQGYLLSAMVAVALAAALGALAWVVGRSR